MKTKRTSTEEQNADYLAAPPVSPPGSPGAQDGRLRAGPL